MARVDHMVPGHRPRPAAGLSTPDPADRLTWSPGDAAQCDLWFPPKRIPLEDGTSALLLPVLVIVAAHSRFTVGRMLPTRKREDLLLGSWELTGRVMAPFVQRQYGNLLYAAMREIKNACDPRHILNPGVMISNDPTEHLRNLKTVPPVDAEVGHCVECAHLSRRGSAERVAGHLAGHGQGPRPSLRRRADRTRRSPADLT